MTKTKHKVQINKRVLLTIKQLRQMCDKNSALV